MVIYLATSGAPATNTVIEPARGLLSSVAWFALSKVVVVLKRCTLVRGRHWRTRAFAAVGHSCAIASAACISLRMSRLGAVRCAVVTKWRVTRNATAAPRALFTTTFHDTLVP